MTCEHPKYITTKDNRRMLVSCGKCLSCLIDKSRSKTRVLIEHEKNTKFTYFVTLTYNKYNVPRLGVSVHKDMGRFGKNVLSLADADTGEYLGHCYYPYNDYLKIKSRSDDCYVHYARFSDAQKFVKRLRYYLSKYSNEKVTYYLCSEYGPRTFRPHFHLLLYINDPKQLTHLRECLYKAWTLGFVDYSLSRNSAQSYVAGYLNSYVSLPEIFKVPAISPKSVHSTKMALPTFDADFKEIYKNDPTRFVRYFKYTNSDGVTALSSPWRSFKTYLFPKCYGYACKSTYERITTYGINSTLVARYGGKAEAIVDGIKIDFENNTLPYSVAVSMLKSHDGIFILPTDDILLARVYATFHYQKLMDIFHLSPRQLSLNIDEFYSRLDYQNLKEMYECINNSAQILDDEEYQLFSQCYVYGTYLTDNEYTLYNGMVIASSLLDEWYHQSRIYKSIVTKRHFLYNKAVKHKELNDMNNVLIKNHTYINH